MAKRRIRFFAGYPCIGTNSWAASGYGKTREEALADLDRCLDGMAIQHVVSVYDKIIKETPYRDLPTVSQCERWAREFKRDFKERYFLRVTKFYEEYDENYEEWSDYKKPEQVYA